MDIKVERLTEMARRVLILAEDEAHRLKHNYIGTEHILVGILRADAGIGAKALQNLNVNLEQVRDEINSIMSSSKEDK